MSEKKPLFGVLAGEPEIIGERCADGGKCRHRCTDTCSRRATCLPLSGSGLLPDWSAPNPAEPAPAQDEREAVVTVACIDLSTDAGVVLYANRDHWLDNELLMTVAQHERIVAALARPTQTEQHPIRLPQRKNLDGLLDPESKRAGRAYNEALEDVELLNAAPIAQTAPQPQHSALVEALKAMLETYGPPAAVADKCTYPADHPITKARAALSAQGGQQ